jgi:hypothetical protein
MEAQVYPAILSEQHLGPTMNKLSENEKKSLEDQLALIDELGEPEQLVPVLRKLSAAKHGEKWRHVWLALGAAEEELERLNAPREKRYVDLEGHIDASPKVSL